MFNGFVCRSWSCIAEKTQYAGHPHGVTLSRLRRHFKTSILQPCNLLVLEAGRKRTLDTLFGRREKYFLPKLLLPSLLSAQWRIDPASPMSLIVEPGMRPTFNAPRPLFTSFSLLSALLDHTITLKHTVLQGDDSVRSRVRAPVPAQVHFLRNTPV